MAPTLKLSLVTRYHCLTGGFLLGKHRHTHCMHTHAHKYKCTLTCTLSHKSSELVHRCIQCILYPLPSPTGWFMVHFVIHCIFLHTRIQNMPESEILHPLHHPFLCCECRACSLCSCHVCLGLGARDRTFEGIFLALSRLLWHICQWLRL